jgi:hypothetical protein
MYRKNLLRGIACTFALATVITACNKNDDKVAPDDETPGTTAKEFKYIRVLVADQTAATLTQLTPFDSTVASFTAKFPMANLYATANGRYAAVLHQGNNLTEIFDCGLTTHDDHVDEAGAPKWAAITATGGKPTHFKSHGAESLIFNDNDGTLSLGTEADFNTAGATFKTINANLLPHHGAMASFDNGTIAVTTTTVAAQSPTQVLIIDKNGDHLVTPTLTTGAIHGNAGDGGNAVFGCYTDGTNTAGAVLVVKSTGEQRLIPNPEGFGAFRLATILYADAADKFIGYVATKGAYLVDIKQDRISTIYAGDDAFQCKVDYSGKNLLILTLDGKLRIYDLATGQLTREGTVIAAVNSTDTYKPVLEATSKNAYIALPGSGEVAQVNLANLADVVKHKVSAKPVKLTIIGFESDHSHDE